MASIQIGGLHSGGNDYSLGEGELDMHMISSPQNDWHEDLSLDRDDSHPNNVIVAINWLVRFVDTMMDKINKLVHHFFLFLFFFTG